MAALNTINKRQSEIYRIVKEHETMSVKDIIPMFPVSAPTIRKDLTALAEAGMLVRTHGEVHVAHQNNGVTPYEARAVLHSEEKAAIARRAVEEIRDGETIILDSGTTTYEIARLLVDRSNLTVITNSLPIAMLFKSSQIQLILIGGILLGRNLSLQGPDAEDYLRRIEVDRTFSSCPGIRNNYGLVTSHPLEASLKQCMIRSGKVVYAVLDSHKLTTPSVYPFARFSDLDYLITEKPIEDPEIESLFTDAGVEILLPQ